MIGPIVKPIPEVHDKECEYDNKDVLEKKNVVKERKNERKRRKHEMRMLVYAAKAKNRK